MRLSRVDARGVTRFTSAVPVSIDFESLGPGLIALTGPNGAGKTTMLEAPLGALYRQFPSRPGWYEHMHGRDAFLSACWAEGQERIEVRTQVDAERRTTEQLVIVDGVSLTTGRAAEAAAEIQRRFGSIELLLSSVFSAQNRAGNFLLMNKGERKELFAELLGLGRLELLQQDAHERRGRAETDLELARTRLADLEAQLVVKGDLEAGIADAEMIVEQRTETLATSREEETGATAALERARTAAERIASLRKARDEARQAVAYAQQSMADAVEAGRVARREAERRRRALEAQDQPAVLIRRADERHADDLNAIAARQTRLESTLEQRAVIEAARNRVETRQAEQQTLEEADRARMKAEAEHRQVLARLEGIERRVSDAEKRVIDERAQLAEQAKLLERVPCTEFETWTPSLKTGDGQPLAIAGYCPLLGAAREAKQRGPGLMVDEALLSALKEARAVATVAEEAATAALVACDPGRLAEIASEMPLIRGLANRYDSLEQAAQDLKGLGEEKERADARRSKEIKAAEEVRARQAAEASAIETDLQKALADALGKETTAKGRSEQAVDRSAAAEKAFTDAADGPSVPQAAAALSTARTKRVEAERALREADQALARSKAALEVLQKHEDAVPAARERVDGVSREVGDWALLDQALGKDGVQALEIDAAGPEVARLCNELLEACYGPRFRISFETLREKKSERGAFVEAFDIKVLDRGIERPVEALSGGERVIVGEAIGLAISILNARKNRIRHETLFRDETAGALDPENAQAYVDLLRRALALGGFFQVIFIAHQKEVVDRADVRLVVGDGRVTVDGAPISPEPVGASA